MKRIGCSYRSGHSIDSRLNRTLLLGVLSCLKLTGWYLSKSSVDDNMQIDVNDVNIKWNKWDARLNDESVNLFFITSFNSVDPKRHIKGREQVECNNKSHILAIKSTIMIFN